MTSDNVEKNRFIPIYAQSKNPYEQVYGKKNIEFTHILRYIEFETPKKSLSPYILFQLI